MVFRNVIKFTNYLLDGSDLFLLLSEQNIFFRGLELFTSSNSVLSFLLTDVFFDENDVIWVNYNIDVSKIDGGQSIS